MAQAPMSASPPAAAMGGTDPSAGAESDAAPASDVVVTICKNDDGSYTVYAGDEPDASGDGSSDDADAMGSAGDAAAAPSAQGQPADSIGSALKAALTILQADQSSAGAPGDADSQFAAGFGSSQSPTPAGGAAQKY